MKIGFYPSPIEVGTIDLFGVIQPAAGEAYSYDRWPHMPDRYEPLSTFPHRISQASGIDLPPRTKMHVVGLPSATRVLTKNN